MNSIHPFFPWIVKSKQSIISKDYHSTSAHCLFTENLPHPSFFFQITGSICHLLVSTWTNCKIFLPDLENQFSKKGKFQPVAEHRLTAIHLPLLNVSREKISSHSGLKSRVAKILCSFCVSMEGECTLGLFSVVCSRYERDFALKPSLGLWRDRTCN